DQTAATAAASAARVKRRFNMLISPPESFDSIEPGTGLARSATPGGDQPNAGRRLSQLSLDLLGLDSMGTISRLLHVRLPSEPPMVERRDESAAISAGDERGATVHGELHQQVLNVGAHGLRADS